MGYENQTSLTVKEIRKRIKKYGYYFIGKPSNLDRYEKYFEVHAEYDQDGIYSRVVGYRLYERNL